MNEAEKQQRREYWHSLKPYLWQNRHRGCGAIGKELGQKDERVRRWMLKFGIPRTRNGEVMEGSGNHQWKGGRTIDKGGYVLLKSLGHPFANRHGYVREHRLVMEAHLGRYLLPSEVVHHKDGNHANNDFENLHLYVANSHHLKDELVGRCPNWTDDGKRNIDIGRRQPRPPEARANMREGQRRRFRLRGLDGQ